MITKLKGILDDRQDNGVIVDVGGVCYFVACSLETLRHLPDVGVFCVLYTDMIVREDLMQLYGFHTAQERDWFRLLLTVQGVGMKASLALLSLGDPVHLKTAIMAQDKTYVSRADGVGPKLAARVVNELKEKVSKMSLDSGPMPSPGQGGTPGVLLPHFTPINGGLGADAASALVHLGYKSTDAERAVFDVLNDPLLVELQRAKVEDIIRLALQRISPH